MATSLHHPQINVRVPLRNSIRHQKVSRIVGYDHTKTSLQIVADLMLQFRQQRLLVLYGLGALPERVLQLHMRSQSLDGRTQQVGIALQEIHVVVKRSLLRRQIKRLRPYPALYHTPPVVRRRRFCHSFVGGVALNQSLMK